MVIVYIFLYFFLKPPYLFFCECLASSPLQKLYHLFVVNEVFVLTDDRNIIREFEYVLPECFEQMEESNTKVQALLNRWREKQIFDQSFIEKLERRISSDRRSYDKKPIRSEIPSTGPLKAIQELTEVLNYSVLNEEARKRDVESIDPDILSGLIATKVKTDEQRANAFKMLDEASLYLKEYEDVLYENSKKRKDLEYRLNELLLDHKRLINETQRTIEDVQSKRKVLDQVRITLAGGRGDIRSHSRDRYSHSDQHRRDSYNRSDRDRSDRSSPYNERAPRKSQYDRQNYDIRNERHDRHDRPDRPDRINERNDDRRMRNDDRYGSRQNRNSFGRNYGNDRRSERSKYDDQGRRGFNDKKRDREDTRRNMDAESNRIQEENEIHNKQESSWNTKNASDDWGGTTSTGWDDEPNVSNTTQIDDWGSDTKRIKTNNDDDWS